MNLTQMLHRMARARPDAVATSFLSRTTNWANLKERVARLAAGLRRLGLSEGDRVAILALNSDRFTEYYFAVWWAGGVVPTLSHNDNVIIDSSVICEYLEECFAETPLAPNEPVGRARMRAWMRYFEEVPTSAIRVPSFNMFFVPHFRNIPEQVLKSQADKRPLRKHFYREMGNTGFSNEKVTQSLDRLRSCLVRVDSALKDNGPWILGDQFTIADIVLIPSVIRMIDAQLEDQWADLHHIDMWLKAAMARPSFSQAFYEGTRLTANA